MYIHTRSDKQDMDLIKTNPSGTDQPDFLRVADVMRTLAVGRHSVLRAVKENRLPVMRLGRTIRFPRQAIEQIARNGNGGYSR
jgi:excisionase family DNA binding protein